ncbi:MAG: CapA family protein [Butyrivibrio sp.]|nr:CapA family protein [Acetatifactor muris]MCM1558966.1 CapA family protein [Butyrivibrio sp.]
MSATEHKKKPIKTAFILVLLLSAALLSVAAAVYGLWHAGTFLPRWIQWSSADFQDETGEYRIVLQDKTVRVLRRENETLIWTSSEGVLVQKVLSADIDNDSREELILLCWKIGRYGKSRPFWVEKDEKKWSQHLFVYEYDRGEIKPQWMSSYLGKDLADVSLYRRADSRNRLLFTDLAGETSCWRWDSWGFTLEDAAVSFVAFGDNLLHEPIYRYGLQNDETFGFLFENFRDVIADSDVAVINQETPLVDDPALYGDYPRFGTPIGAGQAIADAGFNVVTCATNHALDRGKNGVNTTKEFFDAQNMLCLGIQSDDEAEYRPYEIMMKKGVRFALLNYTYGTNGIKIPDDAPYMVHLLEDEEKIKTDIENARSEADFVILFVHWGTEYSTEPDEFQKQWTKVFLDSHADVVIGTHPHALQPVEMLTAEDGHQMLVYYSLGNFISAQSDPVSIKGGMAAFTVSPSADGYKITEYTLEPLAITWHKGGKYTTDYAFTPNPPPDSLSSNSASGMGLE